MNLKDKIKYHTDRLQEIDKTKNSKDFNENKWTLGVLVLISSIVMGFIYSFWLTFLGVLIYAYLSYSSVNWYDPDIKVKKVRGVYNEKK